MTNLDKTPRTARAVITIEIGDGVTLADLTRDLENELKASIYFTPRTQFVEILDTPAAAPVPPVRLVWRGSYASAAIIRDEVNATDDSGRRAGFARRFADVSVDLEEYVENMVGHRHVTRGSSCTVDTYAGRFTIGVGDALVATADGWTVEKAS